MFFCCCCCSEHELQYLLKFANESVLGFYQVDPRLCTIDVAVAIFISSKFIVLMCAKLEYV